MVSFALMIDPAKSQGRAVSVELVFPDRKERFRVAVKNDVLTYEPDPKAAADGTFTLPRSQFLSGALAGADLSASATAGDKAALNRLLSYLSAPRPNFPIVTR